jgi:uncharacterized protein (TIGR03067 family)
MIRDASIAVLVALVVLAPTHAEVPLKSKAELQNEATHIVVAKVQTVFTATTESDDWVDTKSVAEIVVQRVEKGDRLQTGDLVYGRFWNRRWVGEGDPDPYSSGHMGPKTGDLVRAHLVRKDGAYEVILPNGFEHSPKSGPNQAEEDLADLQSTWNYVYYEEKGIAEEPGTKQFVIAENRMDFRAGGVTRVKTTIEVDAAKSPKHFTQKFNDGQVYRSIYVLAEDYLILCGIRDGGRPTEFSCGTDKGGDFLIVLKRER